MSEVYTKFIRFNCGRCNYSTIRNRKDLKVELSKAFFVYGTLKEGECRAHVFNQVLGHNNFKRQPAVIQGDLYDLGAYPGMCKGPGKVVGETVLLTEEDYLKMLPVLDLIEGYTPGREDSLYVREEVTTTQSTSPMEATTYFFSSTDELENYGRRVDTGVWSTHDENS